MGGIKGGRKTPQRESAELRPLIRREARETEAAALNNNTRPLMFHKKLKLGRTNSINHEWLEASFRSQMKSRLDLRALCEFYRPVPTKPFVFTSR